MAKISYTVGEVWVEVEAESAAEVVAIFTGCMPSLLKERSGGTREGDVDDDGWIKWEGGLCPVLVEYKVRGGAEMSPGNPFRMPANLIRWGHTGDTDDIIAYRVVK